MQNQNHINPILAWMVVVSNHLLNMGVTNTSGGGIFVSDGKIIRPPKKLVPKERADIDRRRTPGGT